MVPSIYDDPVYYLQTVIVERWPGLARHFGLELLRNANERVWLLFIEMDGLMHTFTLPETAMPHLDPATIAWQFTQLPEFERLFRQADVDRFVRDHTFGIVA
jgi:hypothetical protein